MRRYLTQSALVISAIILLVGFLQTRDENDRRAALIAQIEKKCMPKMKGDRVVAEWINGKLTCITYQGMGYGTVARVASAHIVALDSDWEAPQP